MSRPWHFVQHDAQEGLHQMKSYQGFKGPFKVTNKQTDQQTDKQMDQPTDGPMERQKNPIEIHGHIFKKNTGETKSQKL